ncbi:MAG: hypothetical protein ACYTEW_24075 [Planctomycetota bacterium]
MISPSLEITNPEPKLPDVSVSPGFSLEYPRSLVKITTTVGLTLLKTWFKDLASIAAVQPNKIKIGKINKRLNNMFFLLFA